MNIEFDNEPVYGDNYKYTKTKLKSYEDKVNTNFQGKKVPKENASCESLSLIVIDSDMKIFYPRTLLEECKYGVKKNKRDNLINYDFEFDKKI